MSFIENLIDYIINGACSKGSFKWYLLSGHLFEAVLHADLANKANFVALVEWISRYAPSNCYGSAEQVNEWIAQGGLRGMSEAQVVAWQTSLEQD